MVSHISQKTSEGARETPQGIGGMGHPGSFLGAMKKSPQGLKAQRFRNRLGPTKSRALIQSPVLMQTLMRGAARVNPDVEK